MRLITTFLALLIASILPLLAIEPLAASFQDQLLPVDPVVPVKLSLPLKPFEQSISNTPIKFEMIYIPGGEFLMGSPPSEIGRQPHEGPQRKVMVKPFWLAKCEVTWDEYYAFWKDESLFKRDEVPESFSTRLKPDAITRPTNTYVDELYDMGRDGHPAMCMTHHAAMMYCHWLRWKTRRGYRLPTEAEWEFACRAGYTGPYGFEGGVDQLGEYAWYKDNSMKNEHIEPSDVKGEDEGRTHIVGKKKPNRFGLHDMHGNVAEWCLDRYDPKYFERLPEDKLTLGPVVKPTDNKWGHVARGGSWAEPAERLRSAVRRVSEKSWMKHDPQLPQSIWWLTKMDVIGFRVALPVEEYPELIGIKPMVVKKAD